MLSPSTDPYGILNSLIFHDGPKSNAEGLFRLLGLVHLYRTSGIHLLAFFAGVDVLILKLMKRARFSARFGHWVSIMAVSCLAVWIWRLEGFHESLMRSLFTFFLRKWLLKRGVKTPVFFPISFTLFIEWTLNQFRPLPPGALHYYLAVAGSLAALARAKGEQGWKLHLRMAIYAWVPGGVVDLVSDHLISFMTPIFSLFTVPLISFVLYPLALISFGLTGEIPVWVIRIWDSFLDGWVHVLEWMPHFSVVSSQAIFLGSGFAVIGTLIWLRWRHHPLICLTAIPGLALLYLIRLVLNDPLPHRVVQWDVGQGDSALIQNKGMNEIIDVGPSRGQGVEKWIRRLARQGVSSVDGVLLSHLDEDHRGGLKWILPVIRVSCVQFHDRGAGEDRGRKLFQFLSSHDPLTDLRGEGCMKLSKVGWFKSSQSQAHGNEWMAGVAHELGREQVYLALGDGDQSQERKYQLHFKDVIEGHPRRIWKVGHHGSRFSSNFEFLKGLQAEEFWISVGAKNPYHHPNPETLIRLAELSGSVHRTDEEGDLSSEVRE